MEFRDQDFNGQDITLDNNTFTGCTFRNCRVVFRATGPIALSANSFKENVKWVFDGPAATTIVFLTELYKSGGEGGRQLVENTFENIRRGRKGPEPPKR
jgi:hypothetical protein